MLVEGWRVESTEGLEDREELVVLGVGYLEAGESRAYPSAQRARKLRVVVEVDAGHHGVRDRVDGVTGIRRNDPVGDISNELVLNKNISLTACLPETREWEPSLSLPPEGLSDRVRLDRRSTLHRPRRSPCAPPERSCESPNT